MDVTFTNVLEGARQYFQGLPTAGVGSTAAGPYYTPETQPNNQNDQNQNVPQASNLYWSGQQVDSSRPPTREHTPIQRPSSHNSDGSRPPSHPHYTQEPNRQYIASYLDQQPQPSQASTFHFPRPHSREAPSNQQYQTHVATSSPFQVPSPQMPRVPSRESRPQSREAPSVTQQYHNQNYVPTSSPYLPPSPHIPRAPSREQLVQPAQSQGYTHSSQSQSFHQSYPSQQRSYYSVSPQGNKASANNFKPVTSSSSASYSSMTSANNFKPVTSSSSASYQSMTSRNTYYKTSYSPQVNVSHMQHDAYANSRSVSYAESAQTTQPASLSNETAYQPHRPTHSLPPVASIPTFPTSSRSSKEPVGRIPSNPPHSRVPHISTNQNSIPSSHPSVLQSGSNNTSKPRPYSSSNNYHQSFRNYISTNPQNYPYTATTTTQTYNSVIMTTSSYYSTPNQSQSTNQPVYSTKSSVQTSVQPPSTHYNVQHQSDVSSRPVSENQNQNTQMAKHKREISPLDLSVKTVRTPADSTLEEAEANNKYFQRPAPSAHSSISNHSYPTVDVNSFHRSFNQKPFQSPAASAPKVEFVPNFNVSTAANQGRILLNHKRPEEYQPNSFPEKIHNNSVRPEYKGIPYTSSRPTNRYPTVTVPSSAHLNSYIQSPHVPTKSATIKAEPMYSYQKEMHKKRLGEVGTSNIPNKIPKMESWRHSIDLQIEQKLAAAKLQQLHQTSTKPTLVNGYPPLPQERPQEIPIYPKQNYEGSAQHQHYNNTANHYYGQANHNQTYVPSPVGNQYPGYPTYNSQSAQSHHLNSTSRLNSNPVGPSVNKQNHIGGVVDKRVLDLLRTSLEVKGQKKLEQLKSQDLVAHHPRSDVQHPNTDVTAPLQPKPGIISRNNVSPFTPTNFPDSNISPLYKFQIPKAMESINYETDSKETPALEKQMEDTVIPSQTGQNSEFDGLAARIRTKGELKQVGPSQTSNNNSVNESRLHNISSDGRSKSPIKLDTVQVPQGSSVLPTNINALKLLKDKQIPYAPRKRLFSRNEEDLNTNNMPHRDKSGLRSSSETSVFDFPDSDSECENPALERQSLEAMRRDRKSSIKQTPVAPPVEDLKDVKPEAPPRTPSPEDDIFAQLCDNFLEQLKYSPKKKTRRKKGVEPEVLAKLETVVTENPLDFDITIKIEPTQKSDDIVEMKCEKCVPSELVTEAVETKTENDPYVTPSIENKVTSPSIENKVSNEISNCDVVIKEEEVLIVERRLLGARRKLSSSEDSSDSEIEIDKKKDNKQNETGKANVETDKPEKDKGEVEADTKSVTGSPKKVKEVVVPVVRPAKKPLFGTGSDFYPGWEEGVYKYKKSLRMPPTLIQVNRPPASMRLSTSLPDLDPCPQSPTASITNDSESKETTPLKKTIKKIKSEPIDSDSESTSSFNIFSKKTNYDSEGSASVKSLPNIKKENSSILDKLLQKYGGRKRRRYKRKDDHSPKVIPKAEKPIELLPTPSLEVKNKGNSKELKKLKTPVIKTESAVLGFRKDTINNFKDAFINSSINLLGVHDKFATVVLKTRTRKQTRVLKQKATIKEVFGEDRPASAPPVTCVNDIEIKKEVLDDDIIPVRKEIKKGVVDEVKPQKKLKDKDVSSTKQVLKDKLLSKGKKKDSPKKVPVIKEIKTELEDSLDEDSKSLDSLIKKELDAKAETLSLDGDEGSISGKRRGKLGKMRRKFSSGFDYIRKKKKIKKEVVETDLGEKKKKKVVAAKTPESVDDIQKEIKTWVLNKGIGETHLHRAARLGYTDITAYCLEKMDCSPSPKDNAGYTPLHEACSRGHLHIAKLLLKYGANVHESAQGGIRPLHEAIENGFVEIVRLLLSYGADASLATYTGITPLMLATDETTKTFLKHHLEDIQGESESLWQFIGPASCFDAIEDIGYNVLDDPPKTDSEPEEENFEIEMSETLLPNLYTLRGEPSSDRWVLLQDLSNLLKIKSRDALLRQICTPSTSSSANIKSVLRELKMSDFLEQARCCQFLNQGEKINTRASKIALVKYTDKVKQLLGIEVVSIKNR